MLVQILGAIDIIAGLILMFGINKFMPVEILGIIGIVLFLKSSLNLLRDLGSWIDVFAGIIFLLSISIKTPFFISIIIGLLILQKGVFSFMKY
ncbi:MAG: hypothetical protein AABX28_02940 [Nanoarchaeota archaeon]